MRKQTKLLGRAAAAIGLAMSALGGCLPETGEPTATGSALVNMSEVYFAACRRRNG